MAGTVALQAPFRDDKAFRNDKGFRSCHSDRREESAVLTTRITAGPPQPSARSSQVGLRSSIRAIFVSRRHFFSSVSRAIVSPTL